MGVFSTQFVPLISILATKILTEQNCQLLKTLIFENFWGPEVSGSNWYQKNIGAKLNHWHMPSLCSNFVVIRSDHVHPNSDAYSTITVYLQYFCLILFRFAIFCTFWLKIMQKISDLNNLKNDLVIKTLYDNMKKTGTFCFLHCFLS